MKYFFEEKTISHDIFLAILSGLVTIFGLVFTMTWWLKLVLMVVASGLIVYVVLRLKWFINLSIVYKIILSIAIFGIMGLISRYPIQEQWEREHLVEQIKKNIGLSINYPLDCWASRADQLHYPRRISSKKIETMKAPFELRDDFCLAVRICNDNDIPLDQPQILIQIQPDITVRPLKLWQYNIDENTRDLFAHMSRSVIKGTCLGPNEILCLGFPKPGIYPVRYRISGIAKGISINVEGKLNLELTEK